MGYFRSSMQQGSPGSDFKLGTFANGLEAKHKRMLADQDEDTEEVEPAADQEIMF